MFHFMKFFLIINGNQRMEVSITNVSYDVPCSKEHTHLLTVVRPVWLHLFWKLASYDIIHLLIDTGRLMNVKWYTWL